MRITFEQARAAVRRKYGDRYRDRPWEVADYGAEDATHYQVVHGSPDQIAGRETAVGGLEGDGATLVAKDTGDVTWVPWIRGGWERVARMVRFGRWPA